jgi:hypothetical protein
MRSATGCGLVYGDGHGHRLGGCQRTEPLRNGRVARGNLFIHKVDMGQLHRQELLLVVAHQAAERLLSEGHLAPQTASGQCGHGHGIGAPVHQGRQDRSAGHPHHLADHRGQLDIGPFSDPLDAVDLPRPLLHKRGPVAGEIAHIPLPAWGEKARLQPAMAEELGQPARVRLLGLAPWHILDMGGMHQKARAVAFQHVRHRMPICARTLHRHMGDPRLGQPINESSQLDGHRAKGFDFGQAFGTLTGRIRHPTTGGALFFVDIQAGTMSIEHVHGTPPLGGEGWEETRLKRDSLACVASWQKRAPMLGA